MLGWLVDRHINPHIPVLDQASRKDGTWSRTDFEWDPENNQYICPEGEPLKQFRRTYSDPNRGPSGKGVAKYQALKHTCQACPSKMKCCPKGPQRSMTNPSDDEMFRIVWLNRLANPENPSMSSRHGFPFGASFDKVDVLFSFFNWLALCKLMGSKNLILKLFA